MVNGVKILKAEEVSRIVPIVKEFTGMFDPTKNIIDEYICLLWGNLIGQGSGVILYIEDQGGEIEGLVAGTKSPHPYLNQFMAIESMFYVKRDSRGIGLKLLKAFEEWAFYYGCSIIDMAALDAVSPERVGRLYERLGYKKIETHYIKEV